MDFRQGRRTIANFFDLSRAYDRVWPTGLLMKMSNMGVPPRFTEWLSSWFIHRTASVRLNGSIGPSRTFMDGLPQGSVIFPIIFAIYIYSLVAEFEKDTFVSTYADDLLIARSAGNKNMIVLSLQPEIDKVVAWCDKARLTLNTSKCETTFVSMHCAEAVWQHNIIIDGRLMFCNPFPVFLCV